MRTSITYKEIGQLAYPIIVGSLAENINTAINTAFVARLGETSIGAVGLGGLYYFNFAILALGLASGAQIIIGRRNGEGQYMEAGRVMTHGLVLFGSIALVLLAIMYAFTPSLLRLFIHSDRIYEACVDYARIRIFGIVFICLTVCLRSFYIGITRTNIITFITLLSASVNVVFDYMLIFGHGPFHKYGIRGAAYASVIAECTALTGYLIATMLLPAIRKYKPFHFQRFEFAQIWSILRTGAPLMLQSWVSFSSWLLFFLFIEKMGERQLAISAIIKNIYLLFMIPMWGFAAASNSLTSNLIGKGRSDEVIDMLRKSIILATLLIALPVIACFSIPYPIISIFTQKADLIQMTVSPLRVVSIALLLFPVAFILFNGVSGSGDTRTALYIELLTIAIYVTYLYIMTRVIVAAMPGVWTSEIVYMSIMALFSFIRIRSGKWKGKTV